MTLIRIRHCYDSALVSFTPGQVISFRTRCPSSRFCFFTVSVRLSSLKAPSAALRAAGGGFWVDRRTGSMEKQALGKGTRVGDANILTWRTALATPIAGPGKSRRSGPHGLHNRGGETPSVTYIGTNPWVFIPVRNVLLMCSPPRRALKHARGEYPPHLDDSALVSFTPGQVISAPDPLSFVPCFFVPRFCSPVEPKSAACRPPGGRRRFLGRQANRNRGKTSPGQRNTGPGR